MTTPMHEPTRLVRFEPWTEFIRRHWLAVPVGLVVAVIGFVGASTLLGGSDADQPEAQVRFGLTENVVWPFYDPARDRVRRTVEDPSFVAEAESIAESAGGAFNGFVIDTESGVAFVDVTIDASSLDAASAVAGLVAERVPAVDAAALTDSDQAALDAALAAAAETQARLDGYETRIGELLQIEADALAILENEFDAEAQTTRDTADAERRTLLAAADEASRELSRQQGTITNAQSALDLVRNETEVLFVTASAAESDDSPLVPLVIAAAAAVAAAAASVWFTRRRSKVTTPWQIRDGEQLPLIGFGAGADRDAAITALATRLRGVNGTIAFTGVRGDHVQLVADAVSHQLQTVPAGASGGDGSPSIIALAIGGSQAPLLAAADRTIVVVEPAVDRVLDVRRAVNAVRDQGGEVSGVCVVS